MFHGIKAFHTLDQIAIVMNDVFVPLCFPPVTATHDVTTPLPPPQKKMYSSPVQETRFVEEKQTQLEEGISFFRQSISPYTSWCQDVYTKSKPKVETAVAHSKATYDYLRDAPLGFYPRLGLIGFAGIVGLYLAGGSRIKKVIYPLGLMGISASLYYPQQAATIAKDTGTVFYEWSLQGLVTLESFRKDGGKKKSGKKEEMPVTSNSSASSAHHHLRGLHYYKIHLTAPIKGFPP